MDQTSQITLQNCAAIVLAAGVSRRFGTDDKLAAQIEGVPMLQRVLNIVTSLPLGQILLVVGDEYIRSDTLPNNVQLVRNRNYRSGMGSSIAVGAANIEDDVKAAFIVLGDMPFVPGEIFSRLAEQLDSSVTIARPLTPLGGGHPVVFSRHHFNQLRLLTGDKGAGSVVKSAGSGLAMVEISDAGCFFDIDTPDALIKANNEKKGTR